MGAQLTQLISLISSLSPTVSILLFLLLNGVGVGLAIASKSFFENVRHILRDLELFILSLIKLRSQRFQQSSENSSAENHLKIHHKKQKDSEGNSAEKQNNAKETVQSAGRFSLLIPKRNKNELEKNGSQHK